MNQTIADLIRNDRELLKQRVLRCAENEGGRARLAIEGYANADTAYYFAREAARYAVTYLTLEGSN